MADLLDAIDDKLAQWLQAQPVFFVATAPRSDDVSFRMFLWTFLPVQIVEQPHDAPQIFIFTKMPCKISHRGLNGQGMLYVALVMIMQSEQLISPLP